MGDFNTSESGTATRNGPRGETGLPFGNPQRKYVKAIEKINYSDQKNIDVRVESMVFENNFSWMSRFSDSGPYKGHQNGELWSPRCKS